jgi:hypothetical protein
MKTKKQKPNVVVPREKMEAVSALLNSTAYVLLTEQGNQTVTIKSKGTMVQKAGLVRIGEEAVSNRIQQEIRSEE